VFHELHRLIELIARQIAAYGEFAIEEGQLALASLLRRAALLAVVALAALLGLIAACAWLIAATWDTAYRHWSFAAITALFLGAALTAWLKFRRASRERAAPFADLREELQLDLDRLHALQGEPEARYDIDE
jgi:uncharacterized membrane protein YqjE